jgi:hypothetical protein
MITMAHRGNRQIVMLHRIVTILVRSSEDLDHAIVGTSGVVHVSKGTIA